MKVVDFDNQSICYMLVSSKKKKNVLECIGIFEILSSKRANISWRNSKRKWTMEKCYSRQQEM